MREPLPPPRIARPRSAEAAEVDELASTTLWVALSGIRARPLVEVLLEGSNERAVAAFRTPGALEEAANALGLTAGKDGRIPSVEVEGVHALAHVSAAKLAGLVADPTGLGSVFVPAVAARLAVGKRRGTRPPPAPRPTTSVPSDAGPAPRVVIVDDDPLVLSSLGRYLESRGATVFTVVSSLEAAAVTAMHRPTVLVLDVLMPGMDGERVWNLLERTTTTPPHVVFYSGIGGRELAQVAKGDPRVERVSKESEPEELWAAVERAHKRSVG